MGIPYKKTISADQFYVKAEAMSEWEGEGELAAKNMNRIHDALFEAIPEDTEQQEFNQKMELVLDRWDSDDTLLTITDDEIQDYVQSLF